MTKEQKTKLIEYLKEYLIEILGGLPNNKIYIYQKKDGKLSHTTQKEIAIEELENNFLDDELYNSICTKTFIFQPNVEKVQKFIMGFNISENDANEIIKNIGIYPFLDKQDL